MYVYFCRSPYKPCNKMYSIRCSMNCYNFLTLSSPTQRSINSAEKRNIWIYDNILASNLHTALEPYLFKDDIDVNKTLCCHISCSSCLSFTHTSSAFACTLSIVYLYLLVLNTFHPPILLAVVLQNVNWKSCYIIE